MDNDSRASGANKEGGFVYVLSNPSFPECVKIGFAKNVEERVRTLNTAVPYAYHVRCTCRVDENVADKQLHKLINENNPGLHVVMDEGGGTEFFRVSAKRAFQILQGWAAIKGIPDSRLDPPPGSRLKPEPEDKASKPTVSAAECSPSALGLFFDLRKRLCAVEGIEADETRWPCGASFRKDGQEILSAALMKDGVSVIIHGAMQADGRPSDDHIHRISKESDLDRAMLLVWQALGMPAPAPEPAPVPEPMPAPGPELSPAPTPSPASKPSPAQTLKPTPDFVKEAEASLDAFLTANPDAFRGKTVLLPRPAPDWPDFLKTFATRFESLGLKKLIATEPGTSDGPGTAFLLCRDVTGNGRIGFGDLEFNHLRSGAGLDSEDVVRFRDQADVVVAAPPQGQGVPLASWASEGSRQLLALGPGNPCVLQMPKEKPKPKNGNLIEAKTAKRDEFYTRLEDVEAEMEAYVEWNPNVFRDKTVLLPCDDPDWSGFTQYFVKNFDRLGLKKLVSTCYVGGLGGKTAAEIEKNSPLFNPGKSRSRGKLLVMERDAGGESKGIEFRDYLKGDGDFRSPEVKKLRNEADFIVTNPPFSLFREFLDWIQKGRKQFIVVGPQNAITYKETFPLLKEDKMWLGAGFKKGNAYFRVPEESAGAYAAGVYDPESSLVHFRNCTWFTNVDLWKRHQSASFVSMEENLKSNPKLQKKLLQDFGSADSYPKYDNFDAIEVPFVDAIPSDYDGIMGVPVTFLDRYNPKQFEIIGHEHDLQGNGGSDSLTAFTVNGRGMYKRILIRNRHPEPAPAPAMPEEATGAEAGEEEAEDEGFRPSM